LFVNNIFSYYYLILFFENIYEHTVCYTVYKYFKQKKKT